MFFINLPLGMAVLWLALWKVPESRAGNRSQQFDWPGGLLAVLGFGGIVLGLIESMPAAGAVGAVALIALLYWEARSSVADGSARLVPFPQFQRSQSAHPLSLLRVERHAFLFSARFDTGARLFGDAKREPPCCLSFC